jgi:hypothetical protein
MHTAGSSQQRRPAWAVGSGSSTIRCASKQQQEARESHRTSVESGGEDGSAESTGLIQRWLEVDEDEETGEEEPQVVG